MCLVIIRICQRFVKNQRRTFTQSSQIKRVNDMLAEKTVEITSFNNIKLHYLQLKKIAINSVRETLHKVF